MGRINREWHSAHKMPRNPSFEQRMHWHLQHAANCACREIPPRLLKEMEQRGYKVVTPSSLR